MKSVGKRLIKFSATSSGIVPKNNVIGYNVNNARKFASVSSTKAQSSDEKSNRIVKCQLPSVPVITDKTLTELLWQSVQQWGEAPAFECAVTGRLYTYNQLHAYSRGLAAGLMKLGVQRGEMVGLILPNIPEYPICIYGTFDAGCRLSTVNPAYTAQEIKRQLLICQATTVITSEHFLPAVLSAKIELSELKNVIVIGSNIPSGCLSFFELIRTDPSGHNFLKGSEINTQEELAYLPFSSGTTGPPKGVMITHSNMATLLNQYIQPEVCSLEPLQPGRHQERLIGLLPFFHAFGISGILLVGTCIGAHVLTVPKFEPKSFVDAIRKHRPTVMHLVTPLVSFLTQTPDCTREDLQDTTTIIGGAAPIGAGLIRKMIEKAGKDIFFQEGYGMTEMTSVTHIVYKSRGNAKTGSCGSVIPNTECKVADIETGEALGPNERGELLLRGPQMMKGYYNNDMATRETIDPDGWLHTGDIGYYDEDLDFYIVDRLKELIKVKGYQVAPSEIEDILRKHPSIADVAVIGVPNEELGEAPRAYIVPKNKSVEEKDIHLYLKDKVAGFKQLKGGVDFVESIPKAPSGKILRRELMQSYRETKGL